MSPSASAFISELERCLPVAALAASRARWTTPSSTSSLIPRRRLLIDRGLIRSPPVTAEVTAVTVLLTHLA